MQTSFTPNVIPNKHTEEVKSKEKRPGEKLCCAFRISVEYKIKRKFTFFRQIPNIYFISCAEDISIFTRAMHSWKILFFPPHSMEYIWYSPQKSKYPLFINSFFMHMFQLHSKVNRGWAEFNYGGTTTSQTEYTQPSDLNRPYLARCQPPSTLIRVSNR